MSNPQEDDQPGQQSPTTSRETHEPATRGGQPPSNPDTSEDRDGDFVYFLDKAAGFLLAFGLGYLVLDRAGAPSWIAWVLLAVGAGVKILFRAL